MPIQVTNQESAVALFDTLGINEKEVEAAIAIVNPQYMRPKLDVMIDNYLNGTYRKTDNRKFQMYRQPNDYAKAIIATRTVVGSNLKLTFTQTDFGLIPVNNMAYADNSCAGKVVAKGNGYIVISFVSKADGSSSFAAADFAAGESAIDGGNITSTVRREDGETIFVAPDNFQNVIQFMSAYAEITFDEMNTKTYLPAADGKQMYYYQKQADALTRLYQQFFRRQYSNQPMVADVNFPISSSPVNQIVTQGGLSISLGSSASFSSSQFRGWFRNYISVGGFSNGSSIVGIVGPDFIGNFQEAFSGELVQYPGDQNTVGGKSFTGINFIKYGFMGMELALTIEPGLANPQMWPTASNGRSSRSNSAIFLDPSPVVTKNMGPIPFATSRYFGPSADIQHTVINGIIDQYGNIAAPGTASNPQASVSHQFIWNKVNQFSNPGGCMYIGS